MMVDAEDCRLIITRHESEPFKQEARRSHSHQYVELFTDILLSRNFLYGQLLLLESSMPASLTTALPSILRGRGAKFGSAE